MSKEFNGHKDWDHWNVASWLNKDAGLYNALQEAINNTDSNLEAAETMLEALHNMGMTETPDSAVYTVDNILAAIQD